MLYIFSYIYLASINHPRKHVLLSSRISACIVQSTDCSSSWSAKHNCISFTLACLQNSFQYFIILLSWKNSFPPLLFLRNFTASVFLLTLPSHRGTHSFVSCKVPFHYWKELPWICRPKYVNYLFYPFCNWICTHLCLKCCDSKPAPHS